MGCRPLLKNYGEASDLGSTRTVLRYLKWLEDEGDIERWNGARGVRALRNNISGIQTRAVPVIGQASTGPLLLAEQKSTVGYKYRRRLLARHPTISFCASAGIR